MTSLSYAQTVTDFEAFEIDAVGFLNGSDMSGGFNAENISLPNSFDPVYESWVGWAITNHTDVTTPGFGNQYSAIAGSGNNDSANYATSFSFGPNLMFMNGEAVGERMGGLFITNSTYAFLSMRDGDSFAKKFGGASGDDPDFFLLTIKGILNGEETLDSINFYLADYRFDDNSMDYIIDEWTYVDLNGLGEVEAISFSLSSSDNGQFGMNTPAFFCVDDVKTTDGSTSVNNFEKTRLNIYPNPVSDVVHVLDNDIVANYEILDLNGRKVGSGTLKNGRTSDVAQLSSGLYFLTVWNEDFKAVEKFYKE